MNRRDEVEPVRRHPRVLAVASDPAEIAFAAEFAWDLAAWFCGDPWETLGPLARVVTLVARRAFRLTTAVCRDRPLLSVEAAARATEQLWPHLRWQIERDREQPPPEPQPSSGDAGGGAGSGADEKGSEADEDRSEADEDGSEADEDGSDTGDEGSEADEEGSEADQEGSDADAELGGDAPTIEEILAGLAAQLPDLPDLPGILSNAASQDGSFLDQAGNASAQGAREAEGLADSLERLLPGSGWSLHPGHIERRVVQRLDELSVLLERQPELTRIAREVGRLEDAERKRAATEGGREEVVGVHISGDVAGALPSELGLLSDPATEDLFYARVLERRLVTMELTGAGDDGVADPEERGPVLLAIDTSASMDGPRETVAKAFAIAVCRQVVPRGRAMHVLLFGSVDECQELRLTRGSRSLDALLDLLLQSFGGGTDFDGPLGRALELVEEREFATADLLVVTDGLGQAAPEVLEALARARESRGLRVFGVVLGRRPGGVEAFADRTWLLAPGADGNPTELFRVLTRE